MLGAIIGDIVGSIYEFNNIKTKDFPFFSDKCFFTDDSVMTLAVADALMNGGESENFIQSFSHFASLYPNANYGSLFKTWLNSKDKKPYKSYGNGSAMRVSPCAWVLPPSDSDKDAREVEHLAEVSASVTHNHPDGIKGAVATTYAIYIMRYASSIGKIDTYKGFLKEKIEKRFSYDLSKTLDEIRPTYRFNETCQGTIPPSIIAFLESTSFEDAIRNAISLGGDSDTLAAITGSIAEAAYGIPNTIKYKSHSFLDENMLDILNKFKRKFKL